ncbi:response regulator transcription factor [Frigoribacterium sp. MCBA15_019]|uniref:response regulator transcription factor n=1 Tax=Frigoribacterium sp. MCBA15_019 TaxID=1898745 RepID=UPI0008DCD4F6|nr:response regulator transcription factor [Frigoribacterium sp. MCBA15_019]OII27283.1 DNA-binding response regulator [Frigoribacterium sp. MCBA15_019]
MIRVMIVDDQDIIRAGLAAIVGAPEDLEVVAQAADGFEALRTLATTAVDVLLVDLRMPGIDGVETVRRVRLLRPAAELGILVVTTFDEDENVLRALRAGADGFFSKSASPSEIADGVRQVAAGGRALSDHAVGVVVNHVADDRAVVVDRAVADLVATLTPREREVVEAIVSGLDGATIAARLHLSPFTVKTHANRAMAKVGATDRGQLVSLAVRAGIMPT